MRLFRALGQETRFKIISLLASNSFTIGELRDQLRLSQPAISQQIRILKEAGLVRTKKQGKLSLCHIDKSIVRQTLEQIKYLLEGGLEGSVD